MTVLSTHPATGSAATRGLGWAVVALGLLAPPCAAVAPPVLRSDRPPVFTGDLAISLDAEGRPALSVSFSTSYLELQWIRLAYGLGAGLEYSVVLTQSDGFPAGGDVWERRIVVPDFKAARAPAAALVEQRTVAVKPGRYSVVLSVRDLNSGLQSSARDRLEIPDYSKVPVGFADLILGSWERDSVFREQPTRRFGQEASRLGARAVLFDRRPGAWPRDYPLHYELRQEDGEQVAQGDTVVRLAASGRPLTLRLRGLDLFLGSYVLEVRLSQGKSRWRVERSFEVEAAGPPRGKEFTRLLEVLAYIARPDEIDYLSSLPPEQQERGWNEFWRRRDPTPDTPQNEALVEFFRRVRYAEQHFQGVGPGWRSDMGRIYIKYGPPDQVESRPATVDAPLMEVWYYYNPYRRFYFADRDGFGRYVLLNPQAEL
jgi:GWxTD domain-containing protein